MRCSSATRAKPAFLTLLAGLLALGPLASSCSKKLTTVDPSYTTPEGEPAADALTLVWQEQPNFLKVYKDTMPVGRGPEDRLLAEVPFSRQPVGSIDGRILDGTAATGYQVFRREAGGGLRLLRDFAALRTRRWPDSEWEMYQFQDAVPSGYQPPSYIGRGTFGGVPTSHSPLTNMGQAAELGSPSFTEIRLSARINPVDSLSVFTWGPVPGAARYLLQAYNFRTDLRTLIEVVLSGAPAPLYDGVSQDFLLVMVNAPSTTYELGDSTRADVKILTALDLLPGLYKVRVSALDDRGAFIGGTLGDEADPLAVDQGIYGIYRLGANVLQLKTIRARRRASAPGAELASVTIASTRAGIEELLVTSPELRSVLARVSARAGAKRSPSLRP